MLRWTSCHPVPITSDENTRNDSTMKTTRVGNDLWIFCYILHSINLPKTEIFVLDTSNNNIIKVDCDCPIVNDIVGICSKDHMIYIWTEDVNTYHLYSLNTRSMEWEKIQTLNGVNFHGCRIIENTMHLLLFYHFGNRATYLLSINLANGNQVKKWKLNLDTNQEIFIDIDSIDGKLYLLNIHSGRRTVYLIDYQTSELHQLVDEKTDDTEKEIMTELLDGKMITSTGFDRDRITYLEGFDAQKKKWKRVVIEDSILNFCIHDGIEINGCIYVTIRTPLKPGVKFEIRLLELKPTLESICLLQIIDQKNGGFDLINILCFQLRVQLIDMIQWRTVENFVSLLRLKDRMSRSKRFEPMMDEATLLFKEQVIDGLMRYALLRQFAYDCQMHEDDGFDSIRIIERDVKQLFL